MRFNRRHRVGAHLFQGRYEVIVTVVRANWRALEDEKLPNLLRELSECGASSRGFSDAGLEKRKSGARTHRTPLQKLTRQRADDTGYNEAMPFS